MEIDGGGFAGFDCCGCGDVGSGRNEGCGVEYEERCFHDMRHREKTWKMWRFVRRAMSNSNEEEYGREF